MAKTTRKQIDDFLALKRIAVVGVSRDSGCFNNSLFRDMRKRGYEVVPVNPASNELEDQPCFARVQDITPAVDGVLVMTQASASEQVVRDCVEAGVRHVWLYKGAAPGAVSAAALKVCEENGIDVVEGHCPYMFFSYEKGQGGFVHNFHAFFKKIGGSYPA